MDRQSIFNLIFGAVLTIAGWVARQVWEAVNALRSDIHQIEVELPKSYVLKTDLDKRMEHIESMFQRIYDKLDEKADK
jgi:hypothetical protein